MNKQISYDYVLIGLLVRYFSSLPRETSKREVFEGLGELKATLVNGQMQVAEFGLDYIVKQLKQLSLEISDTQYLDPASHDFLRSHIMNLESTIFAEASTKFVLTTPTRRFTSEYLINSPENLLKKDIFGKLSDIAKFDFTCSCRCILYGEATASAFHVLRATEDTLKNFYFKYRPTDRLEKPMWGSMSAQLRALTSNKPSETILNTLDLVRVSYRNPTQHPEAKYDIESAQDLLGVCIDLINKMASEL